MTWWRFRIESKDLDAITFELSELGAQGIEHKANETFDAYFNTNDELLLRTKLLALDLEIVAAEEIRNENWAAQCPDLWEPITIGNFQIQPVEGSSTAKSASAREILIVPGTGFGTGHHASTAMVIELIQSPDIQSLKPEKVCDVGTGSGILAIVVTKIFPKSRVNAIDIDLLALENAATNIRLNHMEGQILLSQEPLASFSGQFDLIVANLYAEMLCSLQAELVKKLRKGGLLIVSGIMQQLWEEVSTTYCSPDACTLIKSIDRQGWKAGILRKT